VAQQFEPHWEHNGKLGPFIKGLGLSQQAKTDTARQGQRGSFFGSVTTLPMLATLVSPTFEGKIYT